jgi:putative phage-type endonuclease
MSKIQRIPTAKLTYEEWVELRKSLVYKGMVGGSDASTLLGLNPWTSKITRWNQSVGTANIKNIDNEIMFHGRLLEDYVADLWQYWTGDPIEMINNYQSKTKLRKSIRRNSIFINPKYPFLFANIDRQITMHDEQHGKGVLEIKTISGYNADKWSGGIPPYYIAQIQLYMLVLGYEYGQFAFLKDGRHMDVFTVEANPNIQETILEEAERFYLSVQEARNIIDIKGEVINTNEKYRLISHLEPDVEDEYKVDLDQFLSEKHKAMVDRVKIDSDEELLSLTRRYVESRDKEKNAKNIKQLAMQQIKQILIHRGAQEVDFGDSGKIVWGKTFNVRFKEVEKINF